MRVTASCSFPSDLEIVIPFEKKFDKVLNKQVVKFSSEMLPLFGYPPRLHCSQAVKTLLSNRFGGFAAPQQDDQNSPEYPLVTLHCLESDQFNSALVIGVLDPIFVSLSQPAADAQMLHGLVFYVVKREMQCEFGVEELHVEELFQIIVLLTFYPKSKVSIFEFFNYNTSTKMKRQFESLSETLGCGSQPAACYQVELYENICICSRYLELARN